MEHPCRWTVSLEFLPLVQASLIIKDKRAPNNNKEILPRILCKNGLRKAQSTVSGMGQKIKRIQTWVLDLGEVSYWNRISRVFLIKESWVFNNKWQVSMWIPETKINLDCESKSSANHRVLAHLTWPPRTKTNTLLRVTCGHQKPWTSNFRTLKSSNIAISNRPKNRLTWWTK